ncbi:MAG: hypothetical protein CMC14_05545 [Flavobacteriaceae bacterium]|nr:hypothetical protein [Flavobacteriaceae bacterium]|tara:strand:+ start:292 stop:687 length:396 start_codon:yes stop_codon:yes gene_type:complete
MIIFLLSLALAEGPTYSFLNEGEPAPFKGVLLNDIAMKEMVVEDKLKVESCQIEIDYHVGRANAEKQLQYDLLKAETTAEIDKMNDFILLRDNRIADLEKQVKPQRPFWWMFGGFVLGTTSAIATFYSVKD